MEKKTLQLATQATQRSEVFSFEIHGILLRRVSDFAHFRPVQSALMKKREKTNNTYDERQLKATIQVE